MTDCTVHRNIRPVKFWETEKYFDFGSSVSRLRKSLLYSDETLIFKNGADI